MQGAYRRIYGVPPPGGHSEDCLFLNIHVPATAAARRPVLFWIHGGAGIEGSANQYDGSALALGADAIVVCANYRLGLFGELDLPELGPEFHDSGNRWLADQLLALRWIHDNIADYGGDPDCITVMGQSAGAGGALALSCIPAAAGLVHRAMAFSSPYFVRGLNPPDVPSSVARIRGSTRTEAIDYLLNAPATELIQLQVRHRLRGGCPIEAGRLLPKPFVELIGERGANAVPLVIGYQPHEGVFLNELLRAEGTSWLRREVLLRAVAHRFAYVPADGAERLRGYLRRIRRLTRAWSGARFADAVGTDLFRRSSVLHAAATAGAGSRAYRYILDVPCIVHDREVPSTHAADLGLTFNWYADPPITMKAYCQAPSAPELSARWIRMIAKFARSGDPSGPLGEWPQYESERRETLRITLGTAQVQHDPDRNFRLQVWQESRFTPALGTANARASH